MIKVKRSVELVEKLADFQYTDHQSITIPASSILIGTGNTLEDAALYTNASSTVFSFANGTGNNGLDTGAEAQDQWYALYAVPIVGTSTFMLKASTNAPPQAGGTGPQGQTKYRYLGLFRNGGNGYDATNNNYGRGDIAWFRKVGKQTEYFSFHSTSGGSFPAAALVNGLNLFVANTSTNNTVIDMLNTSNIGFSGTNLNGGVKVPYPVTSGAHFRFAAGCNTSTQGGMIARDNVGNDRHYTTLAFNGSQVGGEAWIPFSTVLGQISTIFLSIPGNPNISRVLNLKAMIDPYIIELE